MCMPIYVIMGINLDRNIWVSLIVNATVFLTYMYLGLRRFYGSDKWVTMYRAVFSMLAMNIGVMAVIIISLVVAVVSMRYSM